MNVTLKYFGLLVDMTQKKEEVWALDETISTLSALKLKIEETYLELKNTNYSIAVNQSMANLDRKIGDQDVIALLPPFAGG